jgi:hypothetical protein
MSHESRLWFLSLPAFLALVLGFLVAIPHGHGAGGRTQAAFDRAGRTLIAWAQPGDAQAGPPGAEGKSAIERGKYLVTILGCNDCHTPFKMGAKGPEPDMTRMLSGHPAGSVLPPPPKLNEQWAWAGAGTNTAFAGPWGISYAPNLTTDEETGIGAWDADLFIKTMRSGKIMGGGRPIMPPMPWPWYSQMTDEDLNAIFAFLQTVPAIKNQVPEYAPPVGGGSH